MNERMAATGTGTTAGDATAGDAMAGGAEAGGAASGGAAELPRTEDGQVDWAAVAGDRSTPAERARRGKRQLFQSLVFELAVPLAAYYVLLAVGAGQWLAITVSGLSALPWVVYGIVRHRRLDAMPVFALLLIAVGAVLSVVTGSPRVLLVRDSWVFGLIGVWILGSLFTRRPFMLGAGRSVVSAKIGVAGAAAWAGQWETDPRFRRHLRLLTLVWGVGFALDALVRVAFALTLPLGAVPLVNSLQWLVVLGGLLLFHVQYVKRAGLLV